MKKSKFSESQIVGILKEVELGAMVGETCRKHGVSEPTTQSLLADTTALNTRVVADFIPAIKTLVPALTLSSASFLSTTFVANPTSPTDADLELLLSATVITPTGAPAPATTSALAL